MADEKEVSQAAPAVAPAIDLRTKIEAEFKGRFEVWQAKELAQLKIDSQALITEQVQALYKKWLDEQKPPSIDDIKLMLEQEYLDVTIKVPLYDDNDVRTERTFVLRELPQSIERIFYKKCAARLKEMGPQLNAFVQKNMDQDFEKTLNSFIDTFDSGFDIMADAVVLILNPFGKKADITPDWVSKNISSNRMFTIVRAQLEVNRLRDFFSQLFQSGQKAQMMLNPLDSQQLRELVR